jgi:hypothetical protein
MDELSKELKRALETLDARAARRAGRVDVERVAARVAERLRTEPEAAVPAPRVPRAVRVAAAVALLITGGVLAGTLLDGPAGGGAARAGWAPDRGWLDSLTPEQADTLLETLSEVRLLNVVAAPSSGNVEELSAEELRALLQAMESSEGGSL